MTRSKQRGRLGPSAALAGTERAAPTAHRAETTCTFTFRPREGGTVTIYRTEGNRPDMRQVGLTIEQAEVHVRWGEDSSRRQGLGEESEDAINRPPQEDRNEVCSPPPYRPAKIAQN